MSSWMVQDAIGMSQEHKTLEKAKILKKIKEMNLDRLEEKINTLACGIFSALANDNLESFIEETASDPSFKEKYLFDRIEGAYDFTFEVDLNLMQHEEEDNLRDPIGRNNKDHFSRTKFKHFIKCNTLVKTSYRDFELFVHSCMIAANSDLSKDVDFWLSSRYSRLSNTLPSLLCYYKNPSARPKGVSLALWLLCKDRTENQTGFCFEL